MQESADAGDEENRADEVALSQGVMLQTQVLGQDERHGHEPPQGREEVLWAEQRECTGRQMLWLPLSPSFLVPCQRKGLYLQSRRSLTRSDRQTSRSAVGTRETRQQQTGTQPEGLRFKGRTRTLGNDILGKKPRQGHKTGVHNRNQRGELRIRIRQKAHN